MPLGRVIIEEVFTPEMTAALSMDHITAECYKVANGVTPELMAERLSDDAEALEQGDLGLVRRTLAAQAATLDRMFHHLFTQACKEMDLPKLAERYLRLALRAQAQSARTLLAVAKLSGEPRQAPVRQTEVAQPQEAATKAKAKERPCSCHAQPGEVPPQAESQSEGSAGAPTTFAVTLPVASRTPTNPANGSSQQAAHREGGLMVRSSKIDGCGAPSSPVTP